MCTAISSVSEALRVGVGMDVLGLVSTAMYSVDEEPCSRGVDALQSLAPTRGLVSYPSAGTFNVVSNVTST